MQGEDPILSRDVQYVKGVGAARAKLLYKMGLRTVRDLVQHLPRYHLDRTQFRSLREVRPGETATVEVRIQSIAEHQGRRVPVVAALITDGTAYGQAIWFGQPWIAKSLPPGTTVVLSGKVERERGQPKFVSPEWEVVQDDEAELLHAGRLVPVYPLTEGLRPREMRRLMREAVLLGAPRMPDRIPPEVARRQNLLPAPVAWQEAHWPTDRTTLEAALRTIRFEELFLLEIGLQLLKHRVQDPRHGICHQPSGRLWGAFRAALPFELTPDQERVIREIRADMESPRPMHRLLQGDVGSGKTIVAAAAMVVAVDSGYQAALMAPTEILAEQHYLGLRRLLEPLGIRPVLITSSLKRREREEALAALRHGVAQIAIGTHALLESDVVIPRLSLVVIDEQHRFGVRQRARLQAKGIEGRHPDTLVMTATPIPRTLAMTLYGDLDVSRIEQKPAGRQPVATAWRTPDQRDRVYQVLVEKFIRAGQQAYVIAPLVEESDKLEAQAATALYEELSAKYPEVRFGLLHGRMKPEEKDAVMAAFREGAIQVLVATTVVEVGVDVPNATVIIIEEADRFGLAQLHQLRGRVGRGTQRSYCVLIADPKTPEARQRMEIMQRTLSGFELAEYDLRLRGPGEFLGTQQSGWGLQFADILRDEEILAAARAEAAALARDPAALAREYPELLAEVRRRWGDRLGLALVG
ncbi:MAG: ATP-dependent DNA helicase RecG [Firmicutes bacterium]|nr:ATP-dependent DNA helicase RecG [Bacillota bacterium]